MTALQTDNPTLQKRLRDGETRFLKWAHKEQYSGPPVLSIPRHHDNVDALLDEAADALDAREDVIAELVDALGLAKKRLIWAAGIIHNDTARDIAWRHVEEVQAALAKATADADNRAQIAKAAG